MRMDILTKTKSNQLTHKIQVKKYFWLDLLGSCLILFSGLVPFSHILYPDKVLENKFFGFTSIHRFLYSLGVHLSVFFTINRNNHTNSKS